jgi:phosphatidylserine decarboxylase
MEKYSRSEPLSQTAFPIARPGYTLIFIAGFVTVVLAILSIEVLALPSLIITGFLCWFFRDPDRMIPKGDGIVVSPADGKVILTQEAQSHPFGETPCIKVSIFMNVFNVHVNRVPHEGTIRGIQYHPGKFFNASLDKASADNERNAVLVETGKGHQICFVQIAGLLARRIICNVQENDIVARGQRFGMICLGSRLDVYLPQGSALAVKVGDRVRAGTSVLAHLPENL